MRRTWLLLLLLPACLFAQPSRRAQLIVCFGDSLTAGYGAPPGQSYPDFLESDLIERGLHERIVNRGVSGATTKDGLGELSSVVALHPDIAIVEFGANDGLRGAPVSLIVQNLDTIITTLQKAHIRVMLAGIYLPPNYGPDYVKQFDGMYPMLARKYKVPLLPFMLKDVYGVPGLMSSDGIHPDGEGYQVVAKNVMQVLLPMLGK
jgi:acyl-CoA thioesterase-1